MIPSDPNLLYSFLNTKLRDFYPSLTALCDDLDIDEAGLCEKMLAAGYEYDSAANRFNPTGCI